MIIVSFPVLTWWGLPLSIYALISTILFTPFLFCFLLISSVLFLCHICGIPDSIAIWALENLSYIWSSCITYHQGPLLVGFQKPPVFIIIFLITATLYTIRKRSIGMNTKIIILITCLGAILIGCKTIFAPKNGVFFIPCNKSALKIINENGVITVIDPGVIGSKPSASSWLSYDFVSDLTREIGCTQIDHFILCRINQRTFEALFALTSRLQIKNIYLPKWYDTISKKAYHQWRLLINEITLQNSHIHQITTQHEINKTVSIKPSNKIVRYQGAWYNPLVIQSSDDFSLH